MDVQAKESTKKESVAMNRFETIIDRIDREKFKIYRKKLFKIVLIVLVMILAIDLVSMIVYFILNGFPV